MGKKRHRKKKDRSKCSRWLKKKAKRMYKKAKQYINHFVMFMLKLFMRLTLLLISLWGVLLEFRKVLSCFSKFFT